MNKYKGDYQNLNRSKELVTEEELGHLHRQLPSLPAGWEPAVADLIAEVRRLRNSDPHRIARLLEEDREQRQQEWAEQRRDSGQALDQVCAELKEARQATREALGLAELTDEERDCFEQRYPWAKPEPINLPPYEP